MSNQNGAEPQTPPDELPIALAQDPESRSRGPLYDARRSVLQGVYSTKEAAADQLIVAAERIRAEGVRSGDDDVLHQTQQMARTLERAADYLHSHTLDQMSDDATLLVQSKPWQAVVIAFLVGIIFGRSFRRGA
ncbi:MAG: hypothetical protein GXY36_15265 [Chloroflexi bacterium]|jgi:ElaB/YqjD/DUF883 family membrane-anchored ribosome-binding protein|nr:hypothetical protein [Chloroflexota bacterium]